MRIHKLAKYFPILEGEEFVLLVLDIKEHGQLEPIITVDGEILDGVNRYQACERLGITAWTEEYEGDDPLSYVISMNIRRRHLDTSQRSMLATEMLPEFEKEAKKRQSEKAKEQRRNGGKEFSSSISVGTELKKKDHLAVDDAAKQFGVSGHTVARAKRVKEQAPERVPGIIKGEETVFAVDSDLRQARAAEQAAKRREKEAKKEVKEKTPVLVKEYFDALKAYKKCLNVAIRGAYLFAPESNNILQTKHDEIIELMRNLEGAIK